MTASTRGNIAIASIRRDGGTQIRAALDEATVQEYTDLIKAGVTLPPVGIYQDGPLRQGTPFWLWEGFHRVEAYQRAGVERIEAEFRLGTQRDAILAACGANATHGLPRSNADKRRAVERLLADEEWSKWSDGRIADAAGVSRQFVSDLRPQVATVATSTPRVGRDGKTYKASQKKAEGRGEDGQRTQSPTTPVRESAADPASNGGETHRWLAGVPDDVGAQAGDSSASPPNTAPPIDMLGQSAPPDWLDTVATVVRIVDRLDQELRQLQAAARALPQPHGQRLHAALHEAAAVARAVRPDVVCPPTVHKGKECLACAGLGWLSTEAKKGLHPSALVAAKPNGGGYEVRWRQQVVLEPPGPALVIKDPKVLPKRLRIQDGEGRELVTERDEETDADGEPAW